MESPPDSLPLQVNEADATVEASIHPTQTIEGPPEKSAPTIHYLCSILDALEEFSRPVDGFLEIVDSTVFNFDDRDDDKNNTNAQETDNKIGVLARITEWFGKIAAAGTVVYTINQLQNALSIFSPREWKTITATVLGVSVFRGFRLHRPLEILLRGYANAIANAIADRVTAAGARQARLTTASAEIEAEAIIAAGHRQARFFTASASASAETTIASGRTRTRLTTTAYHNVVINAGHRGLGSAGRIGRVYRTSSTHSRYVGHD